MKIFTWQMAEEFAQGHMQMLGFHDARRSRDGADGGIDVVSRDAIAQVKHHGTPVGSPAIQQLRGTAHRHRHALFYSTSGYTAGAVAFADDASVALFEISSDFTAKPVNSHAAALTGGSPARTRSGLTVPEDPEERKRASRQAAELKALAGALSRSIFDDERDDSFESLFGLARTIILGKLHQWHVEWIDAVMPREGADGQQLEERYEQLDGIRRRWMDQLDVDADTLAALVERRAAAAERGDRDPIALSSQAIPPTPERTQLLADLMRASVDFGIRSETFWTSGGGTADERGEWGDAVSQAASAALEINSHTSTTPDLQRAVQLIVDATGALPEVPATSPRADHPELPALARIAELEVLHRGLVDELDALQHPLRRAIRLPVQLLALADFRWRVAAVRAAGPQADAAGSQRDLDGLAEEWANFLGVPATDVPPVSVRAFEEPRGGSVERDRLIGTVRAELHRLRGVYGGWLREHERTTEAELLAAAELLISACRVAAGAAAERSLPFQIVPVLDALRTCRAHLAV